MRNPYICTDVELKNENKINNRFKIKKSLPKLNSKKSSWAPMDPELAPMQVKLKKA